MKVFKNFKEVSQVRPGFSIEAIYGGALLGIAGADFIAFYDWTTGTVDALRFCDFKLTVPLCKHACACSDHAWRRHSRLDDPVVLDHWQQTYDLLLDLLPNASGPLSLG